MFPVLRKGPANVQYKVEQHRIYSTLGTTLPLRDLKTGADVLLPANFPKTIAALCVLFLDATAQCAAQKAMVCKWLGLISALEVPTRVIVLASDAVPGGDKAKFDATVEGLPAGLLVPFGDPRAHILKSFTTGDGGVGLPVLLMFDAPGNKINRNAWPEARFEIEQAEHRNEPCRLADFPYRAGDIANVKVFRAEFVNPQLLEGPVVMLLRFSQTSQQMEGYSQLFEKVIRKFQAARGTTKCAFFWTRTRDELVQPPREQNKCRAGHDLAPLPMSDGATCNYCAKNVQQLGKGTDGWKFCQLCNFALCPPHHQEIVQLPHPDMVLLQLLLQEFRREPVPDDMPPKIIGFNYNAGSDAAMIFDVCKSIDDESEILPFISRMEASSSIRKEYLMVAAGEDDAYY